MPKGWRTIEVSSTLVPVQRLTRSPGLSTGTATEVDTSRFFKLRRQSEKSQKTKAARVHRTKYQREESRPKLTLKTQVTWIALYPLEKMNLRLKTFLQRKLQAQMALLVNSTKDSRRK